MRYLKIVFLIGFTLLLFAACNPEEDTKSVEERISEFLSDIQSNNWGNLWTHIHPSNPLSSARTPGEWNPSPFPAGSYSFGGISGGGSTRVVNVVSAPGGSSETGEDWTFQMREDGDDFWYIDGLNTTSGVNYGLGNGIIVP